MDMDMDFLADFSDLARSDFIGGIDNDALDFSHLEQFMQVTAGVGNLEDDSNNCNHNDANNSNANPNSNHSHNHNNINNNNNDNNHDIVMCNSKIEKPTTTLPNMPTLSTVSARINLTSTPIATPLSAVTSLGVSSQTHAHLPESPPDSGSEPPYSPLQDTHGLALTSRDIYHGLSALQQQQHQHQHQQSQYQTPILHDLPMPPQYTPPPASVVQQHQAQIQAVSSAQQQQQQQHHHFASSHNMNALHTQEGSMQHSVRVKHEAGLIMQPGALLHQQQTNEHHHLGDQQQVLQHHQHHEAHPAQLDQHVHNQQHQLMFQQPGNSHYGDFHGNSGGLYTSFPNLSGDEQPATCMLTSSLGERVQVIGTSQASLDRISAPSTPVHSSSRKRKMSSQLDCPVSQIKLDPSLSMSPIRASHRSLTTHDRASTHASPIRVNVSGQSGGTSNITIQNSIDIAKTPTHSSASVSPALSTVNSNPDNSLDGHGSTVGSGGNSGDQSDGSALTPCIRFNAFQPENWHKLCDQNLQELSVVYYRVDADKGFNFSVSDDAFVCQKKNHFQVTCHARLQGDAKFVKTPSGLEKIKSFHLHFYGVKLEAPNQTIRVEQSQSDRSKKPFYPVPIDLQSHIVSKITVGRLHFSETTNNNMRKKGRPNPEQRYFQLVVGLHVHTTSGNFPIISQGSERIIVRASNPGQFESDVDLCWQRGLTQDSIFHAGRVGINTDRPDESLVVHGNLKVSGHIVQPSDSRAKQEIGELDTSVQLRNLQKIRIVRYRYEPEFAVHSGLRRASSSDTEEIVDTGVIAQEVREVIPDAVQEAGSIVLPNGNVIENFLLVNKDRILMENIGAVKELCKVTGSLETRIEHLERANDRLTRAKELEQRSRIAERTRKPKSIRDGYEICSSRTLQSIIFLLIIVMAACLAAVSTLYFVEHNKQQHNMKQLESYQVYSNGHIFRPPDTASYITDPDRHYTTHNLHTLVHKNKTQQIHWPSLPFLSSTIRPSNKNNTKGRDEFLAYNSSVNGFGAHGANDELRVVMEKPMVQLPVPKTLNYRITTSAPRSKHKSKWPQENSRTVTANHAIQKPIQPSRNTNVGSASQSPLESDYNNETSSERAPEALSLPQDFENNSIDMDAQHVNKKIVSAVSIKTGNNVPIVTAAVATTAKKRTSHEESIIGTNGDADVTLKLTDHIVADIIASTSSSNNLNNPDTTANAVAAVGQAIRKINTGDAVIYNVYKTVSPPTANIAITTNKVNTELSQGNNNSQGTTPEGKHNISRAHKHENSDGLDLQNLSNTNESVDNPITALFGFEYLGLRESSVGRRSTSQHSSLWAPSKTIKMDVFGEPKECKDVEEKNIEKCQSLCYEPKNHQPQQASPDTLVVPPEAKKLSLSPNVEENIESAEESELLDIDSKYSDPKNESQHVHISSGKSTIVTKQVLPVFSSDAKVEDGFETIIHGYSNETPKLDVNDDKPVEGVDSTAQALSDSLPDSQQLVSSSLDCWTISSYFLDNKINSTIYTEYFCPQFGKSLNITYIVPLSQFLQSKSLELHMGFTKPLQWTICNHEEEAHKPADSNKDSDDNMEETSLDSSPIILKQRSSSKLILVVNTPQQGSVLHDFQLRASSDLEQQKLCDDNAHITNTILQYNFRIVRDCD